MTGADDRSSRHAFAARGLRITEIAARLRQALLALG